MLNLTAPYGKSNLYWKSVAINLPPECRNELDNHFHLLTELLRHFWSCMLGPREMHKKAGKLIEALGNLEQKVLALQERQKGNTDLSNVIKALLQSVETARERHQSQTGTPRLGTPTPATPAGQTPQTPSMGFTGFSLGKPSAATARPTAQTNAPQSAAAGTGFSMALKQQPKGLSFSLGGAAPTTGLAAGRSQAIRSAAPAAVKSNSATASIFGDDDDDDGDDE